MDTARRSARGSRRRRSGGPLFGQLLTAAVESAADSVAIRFNPTGEPDDQRELTYRELDEASSRLARELIERGVGPGDVVSIGIRRSVDSLLSVWAIAKTGAAYVPVDPTYPPERIEYMLADSGVVLGLTTSAYRSALGTSVNWIELDDSVHQTRIAARAAHPISYADRVRTLTEQHPAYVIFTSGSTGRPKGVVVTHSGLGAMVASERERYGITDISRVMHICSPNFDVSVLEYLVAFATGSTLVVAPPTVFGGFELADLLRRERVTHMLITPGALESVDSSGLDDLQAVVVAGDRFGPDLVTRWARDGRALLNGYGPTEATVLAASSTPLTPGETVTIGNAIPGFGLFVLDSRLRPVPDGVTGELYLGGPALAQGYLNRPGLTAARFVANPFGDGGTAGSRLYRTGDQARRLDTEGGGIEILGRSDFQVKVRGFRVELGEIDDALSRHSDIDFAVTLGKRPPNGTTMLVSYVLPTSGTTVDTGVLADFIGESLPAYMIPSSIIVLDKIPLTPIGKLDRAALPEPVFEAKEFRAPSTPVEEIVADVFAALLVPGDGDNPGRVGADDDFFELGGNSLLAAQAAARIGSALDVRVPVQLLFEATTVAALAQCVEQHTGPAKGQTLRPMPRPERIPLSYAQQRMWFLNRFDTASGVNNIPVAVRLSGKLDVDVLRAAVRNLVERHEVLRTVYPEFDGEGYQLVLPVSDARAVPGLPVIATSEAEVPGLVAEAAITGFDVLAAPPIRVRLLQLSETDHVLVCVVHHIAGDGFSMGPLTRDLMAAYLDRIRGGQPEWAPLEVQYADYALWQRDSLGTEDDPESVLSQQIAFWRDELVALPEQLDLPADRPRSAVASNRGATVEFEIGADVHAALSRLAHSHNSTVFMVVHAVLATLLARLSGTRDIAIGTPIAGRGEAALDDLIGMFVNTLVLRTEVDPGATFDELLREVRPSDIAAFGHADVPFERLVELLDPVRSAARHPLFQVMLTFQNMTPSHLELPGLAVSGVDLAVPLAKFDLQLALLERIDPDGTPQGLAAAFTYATDLFDASTVQDYADRFHRILAAVAADSDTVIGDIDVLAPGERELVLHEWNTAGAHVPDVTLVDLIAAQARRRPDAVAIRFGDTTLTFGELQRRANRVARALIAHGAGPESLVAVAVARSEELPVALLAVLTTGAGYLPIDTTYPAQRLEFMLSDAAPTCVLTTAGERDALPVGDIPVLLLDEAESFDDAPVTDADRVAPLRADHLAYVIYTSGSTGVPKGVGVAHRNVVELFANTQLLFDFDEADVWTLFHSFAFDFSVWELWCALANGGAVVVVDYLTSRSPEEFRELLIREQVTVLNQTPSAFYQLVEADRAAHEADDRKFALRYVVFGGEALDLRQLERWYDRHGGRGQDGVGDNAPHLVNMYGITETTVHVSFLALDEGLADNAAGIIGRALPGLETYVLDDRLHPAPVGVAGEMYVAGAQLSRGYLGRPGLAATRFVANPFGASGSRMYRTGDIGRWAGFGGRVNLEYAGRSDQQVQLRGFRIELGEIESALLRCPGVSQAVVLVRADEHVGDRLVGYVVAETGSELDPVALRGAVSEFLTGYMVPDAIVVLDVLPLTPNGKLDRRALPAPRVFTEREFRAPTNPVEEAVAGVFADVLGAERVGLGDDFFALGGNSLIATRVIARVNAALDATLGVRDLFEAPSVAELAARAETAAASGGRPELTARPRPERVPLSLAQQRMWFLNQFDTASPVNNIPFAVRLTGALDVAALRRAVADVVERHESLRTVYPAVDGVGYQSVLPATPVPELPVVPIAEDAVAGWVTEFAVRGFDVSVEVPLRIAVLEVSGDVHVVAVVVHHIAGDGASVAPLVRDLMMAYVAESEGAAPNWAPLPVQYADYTLWQRELLGAESDPESLAAEQIGFWKTELAGLPERIDLPADRPRPQTAAGAAGLYTFSIPAETHRAIVELAREHEASEFMVVHAAFAALVSRLSGSGDVAIGSPIAGRGEAALDDLVGMFVNTLVLRTAVEPGAQFTDLLDRVRESDLAAFSHAELPFERLVEVLDPVRAPSHHPLFQVALVFQNMDRARLELPGLIVDEVEFDGVFAKFDLQLAVSPVEETEAVPVAFTYALDLFEEATVAGFAERFVRLLDAVTRDPEVAVGDVELLAPAERKLLLAGRNSTSYEVSPELLLDGYQRAVAAHPDAVAVVYEGERLTYAEFDARVNRLARLLIAQGAGPESAVGVAIRRSVDLVVGIYAVLAAGGAYVPLDPDHPVERIGYVLDVAQPLCVLTTARDGFVAPEGAAVVEIDTVDLSGFGAEPVREAERLAPLRPHNTAYVLFTSGSTGRPKGVAVSHGAIHNQITWMLDQYGFTAGDVYLQKTATTFDVSLWGYFMPLRVGATLVVATPDGHRDPEYLAETIAAQRITVTDFVPSMLTVMTAHARAEQLTSLRHLFVAGEALPPETVSAFAALSTAGVHNLYGPTEAAVTVTHWTADDGVAGYVPIGVPEGNTQVYVLDSRLRPVPEGVVGELYLAGDQLARGYLRRPELTSDRFVANPFGVPGARMYRTGDLVVWRRTDADASAIVYLGRIDFQVKFRGQRIEFGEIETALLAQPAVSQAVAVVATGPIGDQLVGYVVPAPGQAPDPARLRDAVAEVLPPYMVPSTVMVLDAFPLNISGKLNRKALPAPVFETRTFTTPATPIEELVAGAFGDVLGIERIGRDDDFFALGGNSLNAIRVTARLGAALDARVPVKVVFEAPKVATLAARLESQSSSAHRPALVAGPRPERVPLSLAQQRMWFLNQFDTASPANNIPFAVRLTGALDIAALRAAVADVVARHEVLRTVYPAIDGVGYQSVLPSSTVPQLNVVSVPEAEVAGWVTEFAVRGFDVAAEVPLRIAVLAVAEPAERPSSTASDSVHVIAVVVHHIAADGASVAPLVRDLMTAYLANVSGAAPGWAPLPVQYADYALWQRELLGDESDPESLAAEQIGFWKSELAGVPERIDLPADRLRPQTASGVGRMLSFDIPATTHTGLARLARERNASMFMVVHAAFAALLARLSGSGDVAIGSPVAGRGEAELDDLVGMFVNTLVLRTVVEPGDSFADLLDRTRESDLAAFSHAELPFERLVEVLDPVRAQSHHPLFQVALFFQNMDRARLDLPGIGVEEVGFDGAVAKFDLQLTVSPVDEAEAMPALFTYAADLFDESTVAGFAERFVRLLDAVAGDPEIAIGDVELLAAAEQDVLLHSRNDTAHPVAPELLLDGYRRAVAAHPDSVAIVYEGERLTYAEFDARVNRLARLLIAQGVGPESLVGLAIRRSVDLVAGMYAVLTAGGAYVPLDPDHPAERIGYVLGSAQPVCVLTTARDGFVVPGEVPAIEIDTVDVSAYGAEPVTEAERGVPLRPHNTAYVIFTSGSTGRPKGVAISHGAIHNQIAWMLAEYPLGAKDVYLQKTATTFDVSLWGFFMPLRAGATLVVATPDGHRDPEYVAQTIAAQRVTVTDFVPSMLTVFAAHARAELLAALRHVFVIGEALPPETVTGFAAVSDAGLHNLYGPTEAAVSVTYRPAASGTDPVPIGVPQWNTQVYVLDSRLRPVPEGVVGELYLAGDQLARGYLRRPDLTADRFVANPFGTPGARMYRTGDLVVWGCAERGEPVLDYLGRIDFQVKFRGQRIELGEIETALLAQPPVSQAAAVVAAGPTGDQLVGYVVAAPGYSPDTAQLRAALTEVLPPYMVPATVMVLDAFPLNTSGKLDRKALPAPVFETTEFRAPVTTTEQAVAGVFTDVLGVERVGLDDDFFALGGNSLSATRVAARLGAALDIQVPVRLLFEASTVEGLAVRVEAHTGEAARPALAARSRAVQGTSPAGETTEQLPLSPAQQRMWFLNQFDTDSAAYNIPIAVRLTGALDVPALRRAIADVVARHEILRTFYPQTPQGPVQVVEPATQATPQLLPMNVAESDLADRIIEIVTTGFDVANEVPLRVALFRIAVTSGSDEWVVVFVVHHIAGDGWSMGPLTRDVMAAYASRTQSATPGWAPLPVQYADYALWQREMLGDEADPESLAAQQIDYWRRTLSGLPEESTLPADRPRPTAPSFRGGAVDFVIDPEIRQGLAELARGENATLFMVVHAALVVLLARMSGSDDVAIGTPVAGRGDASLDDLIGMFVNTVVLRSTVAPGASFLDLLARQRETDLSAFAHADVPFERLVDVLAPERSTMRSPLFQVSLAFQNLPSGSFELPGLRASLVDFDAAIEKFDLSVTLFEAPAMDGSIGLMGRFTYASDLFDELTVHTFADRYRRILGAVVADPSAPIGDIDLVTDGERADVLEAWTTAGPDTGRVATLVELFDATAREHSDRTAVVSGQDRLTYRELDERANRLARKLIEAGAGPETLVAVALPRSLELVVALLATVRAGAGYLPVDPTYPADRIAYMLADARPVCAITISDREIELPDALPVLELDRLDLSGAAAAPVTDADRSSVLTPDNIAYVIYTSGSTGRPKGVQIPHRTVVKLFANTQAQFGFDESDVWTMFHSYAFDFSVWELWGPLLYGSTLVVVDYYTSRSPEQFLELLRRERVTVLNQTPSAFYQLAEADRVAGSDQPLPLRYIIYGGEALELRRLADWYARHDEAMPRLVNMYGITETTVHVTYRALDAAAAGAANGSVIGRAVPGLRTYVLDARLRPVPVGVPGEIYVAGAQLARGYLGQPALTSGRFVANPFGEPGSRLYRSGDLARWNAAGDLEYLGRADEQVKVRGFRIELGEIEAAVLAQPGVAHAAVIVREDRPRDPRITAYVVAVDANAQPVEGNSGGSRAGSHTADRWREGAAQLLPEYMVPSAFVVVDAIPLTANGKLDRRALPAPTFATTVSRAPISDTEARLAELFAQVLGLEQIGVDDSFFGVGGDSIMSIQLVSRAKAAGIVFTPRDVFEQKTVAGLARVAVMAGEATPIELAELPGGGVGEIPLTPVLAAYLEEGVYNRFSQSMVLGLPDGIDRAGLVATIAAVLDHHDVLRSRVRHVDGQWHFEALPLGGVDVNTLISEVDVPAGVDETELNRIANAAMDSALATLDPAAGKMIAFTWLRRPDARDAVTVAAHHFVIDGVSWRILIPDLAVASAQRAAGQGVTLPAVGTSFRRWAHGLDAAATAADRTGEVGYWQQVMATPDPLLGTRALDAAVDTYATRGQIGIQVPAEVTDAVLTKVPALYRGGVNDGLLAALAVAVRTWRARRGIDAPATRVKLEGHGREEGTVPGADLTRTIGWFTSIYPVALDLSGIDTEAALAGGEAAAAVLKSVKEQLLAVPDKGIGYGMQRYLNAATAGELTGDLGQISFNYLGRVSAGGVPEGLADLGWLPTVDLGAVAGEQDPAMPTPAVIDINAIVNETAAGPQMDVSFAYAAEIIGEADVRELADEWVSALTALARHTQDPAAGGLTPSDVPLVQVTQAELDTWQQTRPGLSDVLPLSPLQVGLLFLAEVSPVDDYIMQFAVELSGDADIDRLRRAAQAVLDRHANLRTAFVATADGIPVQLVVDAVEVPWQIVDDAHDAELPAILEADLRHRFDPAVAPLVRFAVYRTESGRTHLVLTTHHILLDGWSMPLLMKDLLVLYATHGDSSLLPRVRPYRDYLAWLSRQDRDAALRAWAKALDGLEATPLAPALARPAAPEPGVETLAFDLSPEQTSALAAFAAEAGITVNTVVQAAWGLVIAAGTDRDDVVFGAAVSGRPPQLDGIDDMIGLFVNTIPVRVQFDPRWTVRELLGRLQSEQAALLDRHYLGLADIQHALGVDGLFDSLLAYESYPIDTEGLQQQASSIDGMAITGLQSVNFSHYPLTVLVELTAQLTVKVIYQRNTVDGAAAQAVTDRMRMLIGEFVAGPQHTLAATNLLLDAEQAALDAVNDTTAPEFVDDATLVSLFHAQCGRTPDAPAVTFGDKTLTYAELRSRASHLAGELVRRGAGPETRIAVATRRSLELVVAIYAVLETGAAYVPVDPDHPVERNDYVLTGSAPLCVLTTVKDGFETDTAATVLDVEQLEAASRGANIGFTAPEANIATAAEWISEPSESRPGDSKTRPDNTAYVIYTSGSTGRPKGVMITHRQMVNQFRWAQREYPHTTGDVVLHKTPITFDISTWELFWPLQTGARIVVAEPDGHRDPRYLAEVIEKESVGTVHFVPSMLDAYLELEQLPNALPRRVFAAGEALTATTAAAFHERLSGELYNWYGPAEATVVTAAAVPAPTPPSPTRRGEIRSAVPIGAPAANTRVFVLDRQLRQVPVGATGELYVAGVQLARGYLGAPALTAERFVASPYEPGAQLYRTGDIVKLVGRSASSAPAGELESPVLEYLGRADFQVKLRGQRIELGEIEAVLLEHDSVGHAAVALVPEPDRLVGCVVAASGHTIDEVALLEHTRRGLPAYMVPSVLVTLPELPLNANGKLDRNALPVPAFTARPYREPETPLQQAVAAVFAEVLGIERAGLDDDFFALGGTSLVAGQAVSRLRRATGAQLRVQWFFLDPTVAGISARLVEALESGLDYDAGSDASMSVMLPIRKTGSRTPLFCIHPMYGLSWCYSGLAQQLDPQQPIYGVQSPALSEDADPPESLHDMAARYLAEITAVQPEGPYRLLGWSLGGVLAHEIAVRLRAAGQEVELLAMLDSDHSFDIDFFHDAMLEVLAEIGIQGIDAQQLSVLSEADFVKLYEAIPTDMVALTPDRLRRIYTSAVRSAELTQSYTPQVFDGTVQFFKAMQNEGVKRDMVAAWRPYAAGVTVHPVAAGHEAMTEPEALAVIGPVLADLLRAGDRK